MMAVYRASIPIVLTVYKPAVFHQRNLITDGVCERLATIALEPFSIAFKLADILPFARAIQRSIKHSAILV